MQSYQVVVNNLYHPYVSLHITIQAIDLCIIYELFDKIGQGKN